MKNTIPDFNKIRLDLLDIVHRRGGHSTSSLSCLEILASVLQLKGVNDSKNPKLDFVISKGHAEIGVYMMLKEYEYIDDDFIKDEYRTNNFKLPGHITNTIPGIIYSAGSLGHGLGFSVGLAYGKKLRKDDRKTIVLISDGECCEGSTYEALNVIGSQKLENLLIILDHNKIASCSFTNQITNISAFESFCSSHGINIDKIDDHSFDKLSEYIHNWHNQKSSPTQLLVADTVKGKGFKHLQNSPLWHVLPIDDNAYEKALSTKEF